MTEKKDHDILIELSRDVCWLKKAISNHLKHHWAVELALLGAVITLIVTLIVR
jgi:hypothetical protein